MSELHWGLMGPDVIISTRRARTLGLGAVVRNFNDAAVPGLGGLWYGKQLLWSLLGIHIATFARYQGKRVTNVEVANAIEAMACIIAMHNEPLAPSRIRGKDKLSGKYFCPFSEARKPSFYVSQPMRMSLVQPLLQLGLVKAETQRFNAYSLSDVGKKVLTVACAPYGTINRGVPAVLLQWVMGELEPWNSPKLKECLHPAIHLSKETKALFRVLLDANPRRKNAFLWVQDILTTAPPLDWEQKPAQLAQEHWHALRAGSRLFAARDAALAALETVEKQLDKTQKSFLVLSKVQAHEALHSLKLAAQSFLDQGYEECDAIHFCRGCVEEDEQKVLRFLLKLDGRVLRLVGDEVLPGEAFQKGIGSVAPLSDTAKEQNTEEPSTSEDALSQLPNISHRIYNLLHICQDLLQI